MSEAPSPRPYGTCRILLTCAGVALITALAGLAAVTLFIGSPPEDGLPDLAKFIGRFHPLVLHLPIGMMIWVLIHETIIVFAGKGGRSSSLTAMGFAAFSAVAASLLGYVLYFSIPEYDPELAERHLYGGLAFTCLALTAWVVKLWVDAAGGRGALLYRLLLLASVGVMGFTSHDGASMTHGGNYLTEYAPAPVRKLLGLPERPETTVQDITVQPVYAGIVKPIFERRCYSCHGTERQRGRYRMDEYELLLKGGNEGEAIIPGDSVASNVVVRIELPEEDEQRMPPDGRKGLEDHELVLVKWWIDGGASEDAMIADLPATDEVRAALAMISDSVEEVAAAPVKPALSADLIAEVERLQREFPAALNFESRASTGLDFTAVGIRDAFGDEDLQKLEPVIPALVALDLSGTSVTDAGVALLAKATDLRSLRLSETAITGAALDTIATLGSLESLNLYGTSIDNEGVLKLAALENLEKLYLWRTQVDAAGVLLLQEKLPDCEIVMGL